MGNVLSESTEERLMKAFAEAYATVFEEGAEPARLREALGRYHDAMAEKVRESMEPLVASTEADDADALRLKGLRVKFSGSERRFMDALMRTAREKHNAALTDLVDDPGNLPDGMPKTLVISIFEDLKARHELLSHVRFTPAAYRTTWLEQDNDPSQMFAFGAINSAITRRIESGFKQHEWTLQKLSAFMQIPQDMFDLGYPFIYRYMLEVFFEASRMAFEYAIVGGKGPAFHEPVGLRYSLAAGNPLKTEIVPVTDFLPESWYPLMKKLKFKDNGRAKTDFYNNGVALLVSAQDWEKVAAATTVVLPSGGYSRDVFPSKCTVIEVSDIEVETGVPLLPEGEAVLAYLSNYRMVASMGRREGAVDRSDDFAFLEDLATFKMVFHVYGQALNETDAVRLDISGLKAAVYPVRVVEPDIVAP